MWWGCRVHGQVLLLFRPSVTAGTWPTVGEQRPQPSTRSLGNLAVLLERPPIESAEVGSRHLQCNLCRQHEALIGGQRAARSADRPQFLSQQHELLELGPGVGDIDVADPLPERMGPLERRLDRAATRQRPAAVGYPRQESLLERVREVAPARIGAAPAGAQHQLQRRLAVAVLEILAAQPEGVYAQERLAPRICHEANLLDGLRFGEAAARGLGHRRRRTQGCVAGRSGRHTPMSITPSQRPPSPPAAASASGETSPAAPGGVWRLLHRIDHFQQRQRRLSFIAAVIRKFGDDQGGQLAALISYYGFVSLFPLLLVLVTVLGFVLEGNPGEREKILDGTLGQFPLISDQLKLHPLHGSPAALAIGLVGALLAGFGIMSATQMAMNRIWHVPFKHRPDFLSSRLRGLMLLAMLGAISILSTIAAGFVGTTSHAAAAVLAGIVIAFAANVILFMTAFKLLPAIDLHWRTLLPGVITASVFWQLLQHLGGYYVDHVLKRTGPLYGVFALVLGLLAWLYLGAQMTILAAEVNVVKHRQLWPRSFFGEPLLDADRRSLTGSAEAEERVPSENVEVNFDGQ